jgi:hypothetical protein
MGTRATRNLPPGSCSSLSKNCRRLRLSLAGTAMTNVRKVMTSRMVQTMPSSCALTRTVMVKMRSSWSTNEWSKKGNESIVY